MKYFIDTEFLEGTQTKTFLGIPIGKTWKFLDAPYRQIKPTIDLISIGICSGDGREYYAISKDFNLKEAWNRHDLKLPKNMGDEPIKEYWIRENVLKPIFNELLDKEYSGISQYKAQSPIYSKNTYTYKEFKRLINKYGKTNEQIAEEIISFFCEVIKTKKDFWNRPEIYGYYADYDWVAFCWLFGKMIDLPDGFPMFAFDIQQLIEDNNIDKEKLIQNIPQEGIHNSLQDAIWNKKAFNYIQTIINEKRSN